MSRKKRCLLCNDIFESRWLEDGICRRCRGNTPNWRGGKVPVNITISSENLKRIKEVVGNISGFIDHVLNEYFKKE